MLNKKHDESIDWHAAFYDAIQQELIHYSNVLHFEREHQLNDEPLRIDVLVIRKQADVKIEKNIAEIYRGHNLVEYVRQEAA